MGQQASQLLTLSGSWSFGIDGGAQGTINLGVYVPAKALLIGFKCKTITLPTSGGAATFAFGLTGGTTSQLMAATAIGGLAAAGSWIRGVDLDANPLNIDAVAQVTMTIAVADATAGILQFQLLVCNLDR